MRLRAVWPPSWCTARGKRSQCGRRHGSPGRGASGYRGSVECSADLGRVTVTTRLEPGQRLRIVKFVAYGWSSRRSRSALHDQVVAALTGRAADRLGRAARRATRLSGLFWERADVEVDGDPELQQAVRFGLFHVLQAGARGEDRCDPGQGPDRSGLRRPRVLGHRDLRAPAAHLHVAQTRPPRRSAGGRRRSLPRASAPPAGPARRGLSVAHDQRAGVLGVLAGQHGGVSHQCRYRRRGDPLCRRNRRR